MTILGGIVLLLIGAVPFLAYPWIVSGPYQNVHGDSDVRQATNLQIFDDQIRVYKAQLGAGELTSNQHRRLILEAQRNLLDDTLDTMPVVKASGSLWGLPALYLFLILFCLGLYRTIGAFEDEKIASLLERYAARGSVESDMEFEFEQLRILLEKRVRDTPENVFYWTLLGEFALGRSEFNAASKYFATASDLDPENAYLLIQHAQTLFLADRGVFTDQVREATNKAFEKDRDNKIILRLKGIDALSRGQVAQAMLWWEKAGLELDEKMLRSKSTRLKSDINDLNMQLEK